MVSVRRVLESLIAVNDQSRHVFSYVERLAEGLKNQLIIVTKAEVVSYDLVVVEILYSRQISLLLIYLILRHISYPLLVRGICCEMAVRRFFATRPSDTAVW